MFKRLGVLPAFLLAALLGACTVKPQASSVNSNVAPEELVARLAMEMDQGCADGWIAGREPRVFKSGYRRIPSVEKAKFALAYAKFLVEQKQDLSVDMNSYVPYAKRALFAYHYWSSEKSFRDSSPHLQNYWVHESLLDASELYWRALEGEGPADSARVIGHDTEQNMVYKFMESENKQSSRSDFRNQLSAEEKR
ncbi:MAG: hypothetical protein K2W82_15475 [Candidatus Obscuribacterales bacterium]|nr:hypothetical protein [Candidatus Obscuribacterales bacterium]